MIFLQSKPIGVSQIKIILTMKKQYIAPALKVVAFRMEHGFNGSAFERSTGVFLQQSLDNEFRAEQFSFDDWSSSSPSSADGQFNYNDWGRI